MDAPLYTPSMFVLFMCPALMTVLYTGCQLVACFLGEWSEKRLIGHSYMCPSSY